MCVGGNVYIRVRYKGSALFHYVEDIAELFIDCGDILEYKPGAYRCNIKGTTLTVDEFLQILFEKCPHGEKLINIDENGFNLPYPDAMKQETLDQLFTFDENDVDINQVKHLKGTKVTSIRDAIHACVDMFEKLNKEGKLHDRDLIV